MRDHPHRTTTTPQVPIIEGPITRSKARELHKELDKVTIYITNAILELANLEEGTRVPLEANITTFTRRPPCFPREQESRRTKPGKARLGAKLTTAQSGYATRRMTRQSPESWLQSQLGP